MRTINFTQNWAGKLDKKLFTTIRLYTSRSYVPGDAIKITLGRNAKKRKQIAVGRIVSVRKLKLMELTEEMCKADTGYGFHATVKMIQTMYKHVVSDWSAQWLVLYNIEVTGRYPQPEQGSISFT